MSEPVSAVQFWRACRVALREDGIMPRRSERSKLYNFSLGDYHGYIHEVESGRICMLDMDGCSLAAAYKMKNFEDGPQWVGTPDPVALTKLALIL